MDPCAWIDDVPTHVVDAENRSLSLKKGDCTLALGDIVYEFGADVSRTVHFEPAITMANYTRGLRPASQSSDTTGTVTYRETVTTESGRFTTTARGTYAAKGTMATVVGTGGTIRQWAESASASEGGGSGDGSAGQAAGSPDVWTMDYSHRAWLTKPNEGHEATLELRFAKSAVPNVVDIFEAETPGAVVRIEGWSGQDDGWVTLWEGSDPTPQSLEVFGPKLATMAGPTDRIRLTLLTWDGATHGIDAVALAGSPGWALRLVGAVQMTGTAEVCHAEDCFTSPWMGTEAWNLVADTAAGSVGHQLPGVSG